MATDPFVPRDPVHAQALTALWDSATAYLALSRRTAGSRPNWVLYEPDHPNIPLAEGFRSPQDAVMAVTTFLRPTGKWPTILWLPSVRNFAA